PAGPHTADGVSRGRGDCLHLQLCHAEPGDIISTGTPAGVGHSTNTFLKPGDVLSASIERIGTLQTPVLVDD
ncbi:MAG: fumarylacetoacetate hydrolase family protein, partial [Planctomycetaceae bacterium]